MPVTAKLSRQFYDRFGDQIANELVEWFNAVDATYRANLRELNELNFGRFDAKLEQRFVQHDAKWEQRFAQLDAKWEQRFAQLDAKVEGSIRGLASEMQIGFARFETKFATLRSDLLRWMFLFWVTTLAALVGLARIHP